MRCCTTFEPVQRSSLTGNQLLEVLQMCFPAALDLTVNVTRHPNGFILARLWFVFIERPATGRRQISCSWSAQGRHRFRVG